ncbi:MAG: PAS domain-containing sensor histidine kinase [Ktedonobacterales bacterium]
MNDGHPKSTRLDLPSPPSPTALLDSSLLAPAVLEALGDAVVVYDEAGRLVASNPAAETLLGLALPGRKEALAVPIGEREGATAFFTLESQPLPREDWPPVRVLRGEVLTGAQTMDVIAHSADGQERILNISGAPLLDAQGTVMGAVCVCRDVTERMQLERELAQRAAELETIFATQVEGVVLVDNAGRPVRMNEAQRRLLASKGMDPEARIDTWAELLPPCDAAGQPIPRERFPYVRALRGETVTGEKAVEFHQRAQDGRDVVLRVSAAPVRDAEGRILGVVLTTYDVTQQRRLEQQRLDIMRVVAHELNNPVAAVRLYFDTQQRRLRRGQPPFTPDDQLLSDLEYAMTRMQRLLDDIRVVTTVELGMLSLKRARHDVAALCRAEAATQQAVTRRTVQVETPPEPVWAEVDGERIGQVIANLLTNALKYSPPDQPVGVTVGVAQGQVRVAVRDAGPGIPADEQQHLFEQFHRVQGIETYDDSGGLGLGLYISKAIVAQHGGEMGVESTLGVGSTFWFALPLAAGGGESVASGT